jgi:hypothetical protein
MKLVEAWATYLVVDLPTPLKNGVCQMGLLFPIYGKIYNVPNHQQDILIYIYVNIPHFGTNLII